MLERDFKRKALKYLRSIQGSAWWSLAAGPYSTPGLPDIMGVLNGCAVFIETKKPGRYSNPADGLSSAQKKFREDAWNSGALYIVADTLETIVTSLRRMISGEHFDPDYLPNVPLEEH